MDCQKPIFLAKENASISSVVSDLHYYFRDLQSYYKVLKGQIISEMEYDDIPEKSQELKQKLKEIERKLKYIHVLNNSASTVDEVIHLEEMASEFRPNIRVANAL